MAQSVLILAYQSYARQIGLPYGEATVQVSLLRHAAIVRSLTGLFRARFLQVQSWPLFEVACRCCPLLLRPSVGTRPAALA